MSSGTEARTLILGLGNPILRDDRVGHEVARAVFARLPPGTATLQEVSVGGIELLHVLEGYARVLIIDSIVPGFQPPGEVREVPVESLRQNCAPLTLHNAGLATCLELGRRLSLDMPEAVRVFAIGVCDPYTFSESCTQEVALAIPGAVQAIFDTVFGPRGYWPLSSK
jgi:hydrogenase maturation protease